MSKPNIHAAYIDKPATIHYRLDGDTLTPVGLIITSGTTVSGALTYDSLANIPSCTPAWSEITASGVTLYNGTTADPVSNLHVAHDGNIFHVDEVGGVPGINVELGFGSVSTFSWVYIIGYYDGTATHASRIQLYNFNTTNWDNFHLMNQSLVADHQNYSFSIPNTAAYIDNGDVKLRFYQDETGNTQHDLYINVANLVQ